MALFCCRIPHSMFRRGSWTQSFTSLAWRRRSSGDPGPVAPPSLTLEVWGDRRILCDFTFSTLGVVLRLFDFVSQVYIMSAKISNSKAGRRSRSERRGQSESPDGALGHDGPARGPRAAPWCPWAWWTRLWTPRCTVVGGMMDPPVDPAEPGCGGHGGPALSQRYHRVFHINPQAFPWLRCVVPL